MKIVTTFICLKVIEMFSSFVGHVVFVAIETLAYYVLISKLLSVARS